MARDRKLSEKIRGILHLRAAPTPRPTLRKDGLIPASLAHGQSPCEVFSMRDLPLWALVPTLPRLPTPSPACRAPLSRAAQPDLLQHNARSSNSNCWPPPGGRTPQMGIAQDWNELALGQNRVQARFKVFLSFRAKLATLHGQCPLDCFYPIEQLLDVFACLGVIFLQIGAHRHPLPEGVLRRMIRRIERIRRRSGSKQSSMPREKVLEAKIGHEVTRCGYKPTVVLRAVAGQHQRFRLALPPQGLDIESPQVPFCADDIRGVRVQVLQRQRRNLCRPGLHRA